MSKYIEYCILEVPHSGRATAWVADENKIIEVALNSHLSYEKYNLRSDLDFDCPQELLDILSREGEAVAVGAGDVWDFYAVDDAPTLFEAAKEAVLHDLQGVSRVMTVEEARDFVKSDSVYRFAVKDALL